MTRAAIRPATKREATPRRLRCPIDVFRYHDYRAFLASYYEAKKPRGLFVSRLRARRGARRAQLPAARDQRAAQADGGHGAALRGDVRARRGRGGLLRRRSSPSTRRTIARSATSATRSCAAFRRYRRAHKLELAEAAYHSTWYLPAIRELVLSPAFREDPEWIGSVLRPRVKAEDVRQALDTLIALGLLERSDGWQATPEGARRLHRPGDARHAHHQLPRRDDAAGHRCHDGGAGARARRLVAHACVSARAASRSSRSASRRFAASCSS